MIDIKIDAALFKQKEKKDAQFCFRVESSLIRELQKNGIDVATACREFLKNLLKAQLETEKN